MTYAKRLLTVNELQHALAVEVETSELDMGFAPPIEDTIAVCAGLLILDQERNWVGLVHYTAQEYLGNIRSSWLPQAQEHITKTCLTYLSFHIFNRGDRLGTGLSFDILRQFALFRYAARHWGDHARGGTEEVIAHLVVRFFYKTANLSFSIFHRWFRSRSSA